MIKVLLIEDDIKIAANIVDTLHHEGFEVVHHEDGLQGLTAAIHGNFTVAVVDLMLPSIGGLDLIKRLRSDNIMTPVLILSALTKVDEKVEGLRSGGDDYLSKPFSLTELVARIEALARRAMPKDLNTTLTFEDLSLDRLSRICRKGERTVTLQPKEIQLLEYLLENQGKILSKEMLLEKVWGYSFDPRTNVVDVLVHRLRSKLFVGEEPSLICTIRGIGYVLKKP